MRPDSSFNAHRLQQQQHSAWHSPVPYLFGGLAAMLGLIAFALLILACSYWKLSGYFENGEGSQGGEAGERGEKPLETIEVCNGLEDQKIVVIMAGEQKPTFIATPMCSKGSSINLTKEFVDSCGQVGEKKQIDDQNQNREHHRGHENQYLVQNQGHNQDEELHRSQSQNQNESRGDEGR
ncbi:unnamed protein product [Victoria cruziana]